MSVMVIAEIGENHLGDMELAKTMIKEAAACGADVVKFQSYDADKIPDDDEDKEWFMRVQIPVDAHAELLRIAEENHVQFLSAPFNIERAALLFDLGLESVKIASSELVNDELLRFVNGQAKKVFLSTGLSTMSEVERALTFLDEVDVCLLHCVSEYPVAPENANLKVIQELAEVFHVQVGYSDHTLGILAPVLAVALGAEVIEKHFTLDKGMEGTDHVLSADPADLRELVRQVRQAETMLGQHKKELTEGEKKNIVNMRGYWQ